MVIKLTLLGLFVLLIIVIALSYYSNKEGFENIASSNIVTVTTDIDNKYVNINGNTTNGTTIYNAKILYNTDIPVLQNGQPTNANLALNVVIPPTSWIIANPPITEMKNGHKYYIVSGNVSEYVEGTTPLLGSFIFNKPTDTHESSPKKDGSNPKRNDIVPEISLSGSAYDAMNLQERMDLLKDIQKVVRNEMIAHRNTHPIIPGETQHKDNNKNTDSTSQGKEYENSCYKDTEYRCPKNPDGSCPPVPDMTQYIKKDAIPCWGCSLDY
jgi:hypothetical protein